MQIFKQRQIRKAAASAVAIINIIINKTTYRFSSRFSSLWFVASQWKSVCESKTGRPNGFEAKRRKGSTFTSFFVRKNKFGTNEAMAMAMSQRKNERARRWRWSQSKQNIRGLWTRECNGDGWHRRPAQRKMKQTEVSSTRCRHTEVGARSADKKKEWRASARSSERRK